MPPKARYWKNPEHHRAERRKREARLRALGVSDIAALSPEAGERRRAYKAKWRREHLANNRVAKAKYRLKVRRMFGLDSNLTRWQYVMYNREKRHGERKQAAAAFLPRQLVEGRKSTTVSASRKRHRTNSKLNNRVVLRRRKR